MLVCMLVGTLHLYTIEYIFNRFDYIVQKERPMLRGGQLWAENDDDDIEHDIRT